MHNLGTVKYVKRCSGSLYAHKGREALATHEQSQR